MNSPGLTERQAKLLDYLTSYCRQRGYPPSTRELMTAINVKSTSTVSHHLRALEDKGLIARGDGPRMISIVGTGHGGNPMPETPSRCPTCGTLQRGS